MGVKEFFNERAAFWDEEIPEILPQRTAAAIIAGVKKGSSVLDIACGTGVMFDEYLALGASQITGIDIAEKMIEKAQEKFSGDPRITLVAGDVLEYDDCGFDAAVMYNAYPHFADKDALLKKVASMLIPGGRFTVAHGAGRQMINSHHSSVGAGQVSVGLGSAEDEAAAWEKYFDVDVLADTPEVYIISGIVKK